MPTLRTSLILAVLLPAIFSMQGSIVGAVQTDPAPMPTAAVIYGRSLTADDTYSYQGRQITTYWRHGRASAVLVSHRAPDSTRIEYQSPDAERGRILVSDELQQWQYDPFSHLLWHRALPSNLPAEDDLTSYNLLRENYLLAVAPSLRTWADRKVYLLFIKRKGSGALARKLWVDAGSGLVLKREIFQEDGKLSVTVAYSDINFHPRLPRAFFDLSRLAQAPGVRRREMTGPQETPVTLARVSSQLAGRASAPLILSGYHLVGASTMTNGRPILHLRYSDGLNLVSLFEQRRMQALRPTLVPATMRPLPLGRRLAHIGQRASLTTINWDTRTLNLTLMGEMAEPSLIQIAVAAGAGR